MIKNILIKCAELVNREDIVSSLKSANTINEIKNNSTQSDVIRLLSYYNFIIESIFENYISIEKFEKLTSDENNRIYYSDFENTPVKIKSVLNTAKHKTHYSIQSTFITTNAQNSEFFINYSYTPNEIKDLNDEINYPKIFSDKIICYGIVSEFLASKDQFEKSEYWKNRFLYELFKFKTKKERRLKSTFTL